VEGIRTDVRVVNFTLSSGDWYVHQLMRKIYNSDTLPFTLSYEQYNKGKNDVLYHSGAIKDRVELQDLIDYIASEDPASKYNQDGTIFTLFPANKVKITLDSTLLIKQGSVPAKYADKVLSTLEFDITSNYLAKNDLMLLDFLAKNKFKRPVYFVNPASVPSVDFTPFCYLNGFVYRFLPLKTDSMDIDKRNANVDAEASYDILMNNCKWGNLADPKVYVDPESFRNTFAPKQSFMRLAKKLVTEGKNEQAVKVCDYVQKIFPDNKIHFDYSMVEFVNTYYEAGAYDKGNKLANRILQIYEQNLNYISALSPEFRGNYSEDQNIALSVLDYMKQMAGQYNQSTLVGRIDKYRNANKSLN
jgi:hypothetical protein